MMRRFLHLGFAALGAIALALGLTTLPSDAAGQLISLARLAPDLGYSYTWIASESAVALTKPGLYVLVRAGNQLYDVNDAVETTEQTPQFRNNDIYVGAALVGRLRSLSVTYAARDPQVGAGAPMVASPLPMGAALTVAAVPTDISDAVVVSGTGPPNVPLTITLSADISHDLPRVLLSRTSIETDADGKFAVKITTAPLHLIRSLVLISATSLPGVTEAHTSFELHAPSPNVKHPVDDLPRDFHPHL